MKNWPTGILDDLASWPVQVILPFVGASARITSLVLWSNSSFLQVLNFVTNWPVWSSGKFFHSLDIQPGLPAWRFSPIVPHLQFMFCDELASWRPGDSSLYRRFGQDYHIGAAVQ